MSMFSHTIQNPSWPASLEIRAKGTLAVQGAKMKNPHSGSLVETHGSTGFLAHGR